MKSPSTIEEHVLKGKKTLSSIVKVWAKEAALSERSSFFLANSLLKKRTAVRAGRLGKNL